jgi:hypothetical protein
MIPLVSLWLPILASAVVVFAASSVIHMFLGYHAGDYDPVPSEETVAAAIRDAGVPPGDYTIPYVDSAKAMGTPAFQEKMERGPVAVMTLRPNGPVNMGATMTQWFGFILVVSVFAAYLTSRAVPGNDGSEVFRFAATTAFVAYGAGSWIESIWFGRRWSTTLKNTCDGLVYALLTGAMFTWLWPGL